MAVVRHNSKIFDSFKRLFSSVLTVCKHALVNCILLQYENLTVEYTNQYELDRM